MRVALPLLAFSALAAARSVADTTLGGWSSVNVTHKITDKLTVALEGTSYSESVVCWSEVVSVCTQVVSGTNYLYDIIGCSVTTPEGKCSDTTLTSCKPTHFQVQIFEQTWTKTLGVTCQQATSEPIGQRKNPKCRDLEPSAYVSY